MSRLRLLPAVLAVLVLAFVAVVGQVAGSTYQRHVLVSARAGETFRLFVGLQLNPFAGRVFDQQVAARDLWSWLVGLVGAVVVLGLLVLVAARSGSRASAFLAGWLGSVLGCAFGGVVGMLVWLPRIAGGLSSGGGDLRRTQLLYAWQHGLYWGAAVGWLVGLVALVGTIGSGPRGGAVAAPADSVDHPAR